MGKRRNVWLLTGGIGSGKSTVRSMLSKRGALTIDADQVGHQVLEPGGLAHDAVAARGPEVVFVVMSVPREFLGVGRCRRFVADVDMATGT